MRNIILYIKLCYKYINVFLPTIMVLYYIINFNIKHSINVNRYGFTKNILDEYLCIFKWTVELFKENKDFEKIYFLSSDISSL